MEGERINQPPVPDSSSQKTDTEPTEDQLRFFAEMTPAEWNERKATMKAKTQQIIGQRRSEEEKFQQKWEERIKKLEAVVPTGDTVKDAQALLSAMGRDSASLASPHKEAFQNEDHAGITGYLQNLEQAISNGPAAPFEWINRYNATLGNVIKGILGSAKERREQ